MADDADSALQVVYTRPKTKVRAVVGALIFVAGVLWLTVRVLHSVVMAVAAVALTVVVFAVQSRLGHQRLLQARLVQLDPRRRSLLIDSRSGRTTISFDDIESVDVGVTTLGEGLAIDSVTVRGRGGTIVAFGVVDRASGAAVARAVHSVLGLPEPTIAAPARKPSEEDPG